ncbi:MAG: DOMON domain-containing protein [Candidatus Hodarchaeales archaeon]
MKDLFSKRYFYSFFVFTIFLLSPLILDNAIDNSITIIEDSGENPILNYVVKTSKLQTIPSDAVIKFKNETESNVVIDGAVTDGEYNTSYVSEIGLVAYWEHSSTNLSVALVANSLGFIVIGLGSDKMNGADMIIGGYNGTSGSPYCLDTIGVSSYSDPVELDVDNGGSFDVYDFSASENATSTIFEFKIPLNSSDTQDNVLEINKTYNFFFTYHMSNDDVFDPVIGNHITGTWAHSDPEKIFYLQPKLNLTSTEIYQTQLSLTIPTEVNQGSNFTLTTILKDENQSTIENMTIEFVRVTAFGILNIGKVKTDENGIAEIIYSNYVIEGIVTFTAIFYGFRGNIGSTDTLYYESEVSSSVIFKSSKIDEAEVRDVFFIPIEQECCAGGIFYLLLFRDALFYLTLLAIWGIYMYSLFTIFGMRFIKSKSKANQESKNDMEVN